MRFVSIVLVVWMAAANAQVLVQPSIGYVYSPLPQVLYAHPGFYSPGAPGLNVHAYPRQAVCNLVPASNSSVSGSVRLIQEFENSPVTISGIVYGLTPGLHGFHMHRDGSVDNNCLGAGPHFNPNNNTHGGPNDAVRHAGDFGNILADSTGVADIIIQSDLINLQEGSPLNAYNRAIVVHAKEDDLGKGGNEESLKTGNAGGRLACCVLEDRAFRR
ncbi:superoxide dismutase [Cu-Zn] [Anabrus simplex]|uniref:superoxide dismutase [Cu-Zn] n=1 Tax=Anabrus simplex TaxID=316456 RepID=UPI0034DD60F1